MQLVEKYIRKHHQHMKEVFDSMGKDQTIQATKVFSYIQTAFNLQHFVFNLNGLNYFENEDNSSGMEKLIQRYYRKNETDSSKKFYLYRIHFTFEQVGDILEFWINHESNLKIVYKEFGEEVKEQEKKEEEKKEHQEEDNNEFDVNLEELPKVLEESKKIRDQYIEILKEENLEETKQIETKKNLEEVQYKIKNLEQRIKAEENFSSKKDQSQKKIHKKTSIKDSKEHSPANSENSKNSKKKVTINYKSIFDFYSKQTHLTGVKATFDRIQHESQSLNYQKIVHFLRQFQLMPQKASDQKQVHRLYIKTCEKTRDLNYKTFLIFLDGLIEILFKSQEGDKKELLKEKILKKKKEGKILNFPFHTLVSEDFRIKSKDIKYEFKIKPQNGKIEEQINDELLLRRKLKNEEKEEKEKKRQNKKIKYLRRLQSIDPFHPEVLKNSKLLEKSMVISQPIANLDNMERYRDSKFDFKSHLGIDLESSSDLLERNRAHSGRNHVMQRVSKMQRIEEEKMKNLMSGIIERSNAKIQRLGLPSKGVKFL